MNSSGSRVDDEKYNILVGAFLDFVEGEDVRGLIAEHSPALGALLMRMAVSDEHKVILSPPPDAQDGSADAMPRELPYDELRALIVPAIAILKEHYKPHGYSGPV